MTTTEQYPLTVVADVVIDETFVAHELFAAINGQSGELTVAGFGFACVVHTQPVVIVVHIEEGASVRVFPADAPVRIIEVDCGYSELSDHYEFLGWAGSQLGEVDDLPDGHPARDAILAIIESWRERWHKDLPDIEAVRAAATEVV